MQKVKKKQQTQQWQKWCFGDDTQGNDPQFLSFQSVAYCKGCQRQFSACFLKAFWRTSDL